VKNKIDDKYIAYKSDFEILPPTISCEEAQAGKGLSFSSPHPPHTMPEVTGFVAALARAVKVMKLMKILIEITTDQRHSSPPKTQPH
jgi:hypothetical protein